MAFKTIAALSALASLASAQAKGFNYGATTSSNAPKDQGMFQDEFSRAQRLDGAPGFTSARLYTTIQAGTATDITSAIPAALAVPGTRLLLGLWASQDQGGFNNELTALKNAFAQHGTALSDIVDGISVGSEDLYRISPTGIINKSGIGQSPDVVADYIRQTRDAIRGSAGEHIHIGHVDTWNAWTNGSNQATIDACDWVGTDAYAYYQTTEANGIDVAASLFDQAFQATQGAVGNTPVWITETGWPVSGPQQRDATPNTENARTYWEQVACKYLGQTPTYWYTFQDAVGGTPSPSFGVVGEAGGTTPLYDLSCPPPDQRPQGSSAALVAPGESTPAVAAGSGGAPASGPTPAAGGASSGGSDSQANHPAGGAAGGPSSDMTVTSTSMVTVTPTCTSCAGSKGGSQGGGSPTPAPAPPSGGSGPSGSGSSGSVGDYGGSSTAAPPQPAGSGSPAPAPAPAPPGGKSCGADLSGTYQFPHLIVPVNTSTPDQAYGTSYNGKFSATVSSIFNFDIPADNEGKTCSLVFLFPKQADLQTSSFTLAHPGGLEVKGLSAPATEQTTQNNIPSTSSTCGSIDSVEAGHTYVVASGPCAAGSAVGYLASSTNGLDLEYFQDYNPSPIGMYITVC